MSGQDVHRIVVEELRHIPRGSMIQNAFRAAYSACRQHDLSVDDGAPPSLALRSAENLIRHSRPNFVPKVDVSFFESPLATVCGRRR
jgi:hypothetical protein